MANENVVRANKQAVFPAFIAKDRSVKTSSVKLLSRAMISFWKALRSGFTSAKLPIPAHGIGGALKWKNHQPFWHPRGDGQDWRIEGEK